MSRDPIAELGRSFSASTQHATNRTSELLETLQKEPSPGVIGYSDGPNLYLYVQNMPTIGVDPFGLDTFYVCGRKVAPGGGPGQRTARACGCHHVDIYSNGLGMIRLGFGGGLPGDEQGVPKGDGWSCVKLTRQNYSYYRYWFYRYRFHNTVKWGPAKGKNCADATDAEIAACMKAKPAPPGNPGLLRNCQTDVEGAAKGCCLTGFNANTVDDIIIIAF